MPAAGPTEPLIRLLFTGDINPGRCPAETALQRNDFTWSYRFVAEDLNSADLAVGSLDGTISDLAPPDPCPFDYQENTNLIGPSRTVEGLAFAGFDLITLATNHALDCGTLGWGCEGKVLEETRRHLLEAGILPAGNGQDLTAARQPMVLERQGVRFAFLAVNAVSGETTWARSDRAGTAPLSDAAIGDVVADIAAARLIADVVIVLPHWGTEYAEIPDAVQRLWAQQMVAAGADLIIGNHAHVIQPVETFPQGSVVAYALGNFVFDQRPLYTRQGAVFEADFRGSRLAEWRLRPIEINDWFQPVWVDPVQAAGILQRIETASRDLFGH